jgi:uncharacterized membrane protein (UPF0127 family)
MRHAVRLVSLGLLALLLSVGLSPAWAVEVNPPLPTGTVLLAGRVTVVAELARSYLEKGRGLSGRPGLPPGGGMLFVYDQPQPIGIWMRDMRFSLDIIWIRAGQVAHIVKDAPPLKPAEQEPVYTAIGDLVLEVPAGFTAKQRIRVGDAVKVTVP